MPIDAEPVASGGNIAFIDEPASDGAHQLGVEPGGDGAWQYPVRVRLVKRDEVGTHTSHFATCPNAAAHRKPRAQAQS